MVAAAAAGHAQSSEPQFDHLAEVGERSKSRVKSWGTSMTSSNKQVDPRVAVPPLQ